MTSKKALEELERINSRQNNGKGDVWLEMIIDGIKKDLDKLDQYKTIEKEIGIDLITLFKALKNGVYVINYDNEIIFEEPMISFNQEKGTNLYVLDSICEIPPNKLCEYYLKDYGKTWSLDKQTLEKQ